MHQGILTIGAARLEIVSMGRVEISNLSQENHEIPDTDDLRRRRASAAVVAGPLAAQQAAGRRNTGLRGGTGGVRLSVSTSALCFHVAAAVAADGLSRRQAGPPERADGGAVHGKNFCAATWEPTIKDLVAAGYRVIAPGSDRLLQVEQARRLPSSPSSSLPAIPIELVVSLGIEKRS